MYIVISKSIRVPNWYFFYMFRFFLHCFPVCLLNLLGAVLLVTPNSTLFSLSPALSNLSLFYLDYLYFLKRSSHSCQIDGRHTVAEIHALPLLAVRADGAQEVRVDAPPHVDLPPVLVAAVRVAQRGHQGLTDVAVWEMNEKKSAYVRH